MFKPRFAPLVRSGKKRQTIRPNRKNPIKPGDTLSLREWCGLPYRTPQRLLCVATCRSVHSLGISLVDPMTNTWDVMIDGKPISGVDQFARDDGFADGADMLAWFQETHGLPFEGTLIKW